MKQFLRDCNGATALEQILIVAVVTVSLLAVLPAIRDFFQAIF